MPRKQPRLLLLTGLLSAQPPEKFEVASIKLIPADQTGFFSMSPWGGATFTARNISMSNLVELAFGVTDKQISNIDSLGHDLYDISAKPATAAAGQTMIVRGELIGPNAAMAQFVTMLESPLGKPVLDKINLSSVYNIDLKFAPEGDTTSTRPSIFTAIQEQLGLKLESQKVPFETLVIDHCDHIPTQN